jgi:TrmH family RNA methyltransferase
MLASDVAIVLVRPRRAANVAAACRAMKNMGLARLRLVEPADEPGAPEARALAYGAWDVLDGAERFPDLASAVADATWIVGTSGRKDSEMLTPRELAREAAGGPGRLAQVFGPEASGLATGELRLCHAAVRIPSAAAQPSLNLAQAVLVLAYELFVAERPGQAGEQGEAGSELASAAEQEEAIGELKVVLVEAGYLNAQNPEKLLAEGRALLARARPTAREVTLLRGVARQVGWAIGRAGAAREGDT